MKQSELLNQLYLKLADSLNISETKTDEVVSSYRAVGNYLGNLEKEYGISIFPQGSLALGTIIKPLKTDRNGSYDIDIVCKLKSGQALSASKVKNIIGNRLKESDRYNGMLDEEGKRCWTLNYADFHMDILPSIPFDSAKNQSALKITEKDNSEKYHFSLSDPKAYKEWFIYEMGNMYNETRAAYAMKANLEIEEVNLFRLRTPLQMVIQILKRHRDIEFQNKKNKPISIIITTLAARAYNGERNLFEAMANIIDKMENFISRKHDGNFEVLNPTNQQENFADRWNEEPEKATAFFSWLRQVKKDIVEDPMNFVDGMDALKEQFETRFGSEVTLETFKKYGETMSKNSKNSLLGLTKDGYITSQSKKIVTPIKKHTFFGGDER